MKTLMSHALNLASVRGAQYADIRVVEGQNETISLRNGVVQQLDFTDTTGLGSGSWWMEPGDLHPAAN